MLLPAGGQSLEGQPRTEGDLTTDTFPFDTDFTDSLNTGIVGDDLIACDSEKDTKSGVCKASQRSMAWEIPKGGDASSTHQAGQTAAPGTHSPLMGLPGPTTNGHVPGQRKTTDNISPHYET